VPEFEVVQSKSPVFYECYDRKSELQHQTHYCPGCGHGIVHKLVAEALDDLGLQDRTVLVSPVGCSVFAYYYFDVGNVQAAHGRAPAVATALKRSLPESIVITYQGDGDLAAIGTAEILHSANRGEKITVIFINNAIYGMTGGQMAPTTLLGQTSTTTPWGRRATSEGYPLHMSELLATLEAPVYIERVALADNKNIMRARRAVRKALELQRDGAGFSFVEVLSPCPTIWRLSAVDAQKWVAEKMIPVFPLGVYRDRKPAPVAEAAPPLPRLVGVPDLLGLMPDAARDLKQTPKQPSPVNLRLKIAGSGGQGILFLGELLAQMGMREKLNVSWLPSYGPEMRSGSAHCHVTLCTERIGSPLVEHPDILVAMNEMSLNKFAPQVKEGGWILYNSHSVTQGIAAARTRLLCLPASEIADGLGAAKTANMVMLGALLEVTGAFPTAAAVAALERELKKQALLDVNRQAIEAGRDWARAHGASHAEQTPAAPA
jgi:2-oxoisovalerate ferredoxin oxidoreductase beta subunit